jgi:hypothetical protein
MPTRIALQVQPAEDTDIGFVICKNPDGYCNAATWHNNP